MSKGKKGRSGKGKSKGLNKEQKADVKDMLDEGKELKVQCTVVGPQSLTSGTWHTTQAFNIAQGDDVGNRDGNLIKGHRMKVRYGLTSSTDRVCYVRVMVVRWRNTQNAFLATQLPVDQYQCITRSMRSQFAVLYDKVFALNPRTTGAAEDSRISFHELDIADKNIKEYTAAAAQAARKGQLYFCALHGSNYAGGTDDPEIDGEIEYTFHEY